MNEMIKNLPVKTNPTINDSLIAIRDIRVLQRDRLTTQDESEKLNSIGYGQFESHLQYQMVRNYCDKSRTLFTRIYCQEVAPITGGN
jgi:hypothetical protein